MTSFQGRYRQIVAIYKIFEFFIDNNIFHRGDNSISVSTVGKNQEILENRNDKTKNPTIPIIKKEDEDNTASNESCSNDSFLHSMGPLMQDFMFLEKIAFNQGLMTDMLGRCSKIELLKCFINIIKMPSIRGEDVGPYLVQVRHTKIFVFQNILAALDGVSFLKVRSSFWETSGKNIISNKEKK